jgi:hypothetical protein
MPFPDNDTVNQYIIRGNFCQQVNFKYNKIYFLEGARKMQAQAYEGYFESGNPTASSWLDELYRLLDESGNEKLRMEDFPRLDFGREKILLSNKNGSLYNPFRKELA